MSKLIGILALVLALVAGAAVWDRVHRHEATGQVQTAKDSLKTLVVTVKATDTLYRADTIRLRASSRNLAAFRDTLRVTDTVQVRTYVQQADAALRQCTETVESTCAQRVALRDAEIKQYQSQVAGLERLTKPPLATVDGALLLDYTTHQPSARIGTSLHIAGPVQLRAEADYDNGIPHPLSYKGGLQVTF